MAIGLTKSFISNSPALNAATRKTFAGLTTALSSLNAALPTLNAASRRNFFVDFGGNQEFHTEHLLKNFLLVGLRVNCFANRRIVGNGTLARDKQFFYNAVRANNGVTAFDNVDFAIF